jgi:SAM-dependent methyltransferase
MKKTPIEVFSDWVENGKDLGMESGHSKSVNNMVDYATKDQENFSFIDAGCGNGWVVRNISKSSKCSSAIGIDGSLKMITKAKKLDAFNNYVCEDLNSWVPKNKVDIVHSMEVFYYFERPDKLISYIYSNWLKDNGRLIIGIDFYFENTISHSWPDECGVSIMKLFTENEWIKFFNQAGFKNVTSWRFGKKREWAGTLILTGIK